jgi:hypothetical protein
VTREVDSIIAVHKASGAPGIVRDIDTSGVHASGSLHYVRFGVTPSSSGSRGTAVDFGGVSGPLNTADSLAVFNAFKRYGERGLLEELYCGQAEWCVYRGTWQRWSDLKASVRSAIRPAHMNHIHVATRPGVFLVPPQPQPPTKEQAMAIAIDPIGSATWHEGHGGWIFGAKGHVYSFGGAGHFGGWDDATRARGIPCVAGVPSKSGNGYWLVSAVGEVYGFGDAAHPGNYQVAWGAFPIIGAYRDDSKGKLVLVRDDGKNLNLYALPA